MRSAHGSIWILSLGWQKAGSVALNLHWRVKLGAGKQNQEEAQWNSAWRRLFCASLLKRKELQRVPSNEQSKGSEPGSCSGYWGGGGKRCWLLWALREWVWPCWGWTALPALGQPGMRENFLSKTWLSGESGEPGSWSFATLVQENHQEARGKFCRVDLGGGGGKKGPESCRKYMISGRYAFKHS